jgi:hypothetical protein
MASVVMFTTMSFTVNMHYCGDSLVDFSFYQRADSCGMDSVIELNQQNPQSCERAITKKPCCSEHQIVKDASQELKTTIDKLTFEQQTFVATFSYTYVNLFERRDASFVSFKDYNPPFLIRDVQILNETYLI